MRRSGVFMLFMLALLCALSAPQRANAAAQPEVLWVGIQERENLPEPAATALDSGIRAALKQALSPKLTVETGTMQSPQAQRALAELDFMGVGPGDVLRDREARALGAALGAKATIRAWAEGAGGKTRVTLLAAAVNRREAAISQTEGPAPPPEAPALTGWGRDLGRQAVSGISGSIADMVKNAPQDAAGFAAAAAEFLREGQPGVALLEFNRAIALAPRDASYYAGSARAYAALGDATRARRRLELARELSADTTEAHTDLGRAYLALGDPDSAIRELRLALERGAGLEAHLALGEALATSGDLEAARQEYEKAVAIAPSDAEAAARLAGITRALSSPARVSSRPPAAAVPTPEAEAEPAGSVGAAAQPGAAVEQLRALAEQSGGQLRYEPRDYVAAARVMDREMDSIVNEARERWEGMSRRSVTPQQMTDALRGLEQRSDALARAAEGVVPPPALERGYRHRVLAYSLLSQSDFLLLRYMTDGSAADYDSGLIARQGAIAEIRRAWDLDAAVGWPTRTAAEQ